MASQPPTQKTNEANQQQFRTQPQPHTPSVLGWARRTGRAFLLQLDKPSTAGPLLFTCLCLALAYKNRSKKWRLGPAPAMAATVSPAASAVPAVEEKRRPLLMQRSVSMAVLHGGKLELQRMMDSQEMRVDEAGLADAAKYFQRLLQEPTGSFNMLQRTAAKLEMSGKEDEAVEMLKKAWEDAEKEGKTHEAYELQMLLVEMLIYKGNYAEALECNCLNDREISDARSPLYKAVIYCLLNDPDRAKECYREFQEIRSRFHWPDDIKEGSPLHGAIHDFHVFDKIVNNLKKEICLAHSAKQTNKAKQNTD